MSIHTPLFDPVSYPLAEYGIPFYPILAVLVIIIIVVSVKLLKKAKRKRDESSDPQETKRDS